MRYARLIYDYDLPHRAVAVYMYLSNRANKDNTCFPLVINYIKGPSYFKIDSVPGIERA